MKPGIRISVPGRRNVRVAGSVLTALWLCAATWGQQSFVPDVTVGGPVLALDFPEIHIGIAEYAEGPTGATVFALPMKI